MLGVVPEFSRNAVGFSCGFRGGTHVNNIGAQIPTQTKRLFFCPQDISDDTHTSFITCRLLSRFGDLECEALQAKANSNALCHGANQIAKLGGTI